MTTKNNPEKIELSPAEMKSIERGLKQLKAGQRLTFEQACRHIKKHRAAEAKKGLKKNPPKP